VLKSLVHIRFIVEIITNLGCCNVNNHVTIVQLLTAETALPLPPYEHVGFVLGFTAAFEGFVCPQPATAPPIVSSTAALYAAPQFGSLDTVSARRPFQCRFLQDNLPRTTTSIVEPRTHIVREAILCIHIA
jgi:hypothetical protein